jgi:DNA-binding CsgD family transcriptional regulator
MKGFRDRALLELMAALTSSLDLGKVLSRSYEVLSPMLMADYAAFCVSRPGQPAEYDWAVAKMPHEFFARYPELAGEDFVRLAVVRRPNEVLRDSEMLSRAELKRSMLYRYARGLKMPLEYVMAVLLDVGRDWHGGFTLYRESPRRPFSKTEQRFLQLLTPVLTSTVRNCQMLRGVSERGELLEALYQHSGCESIVLAPPGRELMRTAHFTGLVQRWFAPMELGRHGLPAVLWERLSHLASLEGFIPAGLDSWERWGSDRGLRVTFVRLPEQQGRPPWALVLQEVSLRPKGIPVPQQWHRVLTPQELKVVEWMLQGIDNLSLAEQVGLAVNTVKTHLKKIFFKLAVPSRTKLILAALELNSSLGETR